MTASLDHLPHTASTLVVCAHPDDESFGLGAILDTLATDEVPLRAVRDPHRYPACQARSVRPQTAE